MNYRIVLFAAALAASSGAGAADAPYVTRTKIEPQQFGQLVAVLATETRTGGRFEWITPAERAEVDAALARMGEMLAGRSSLAELREDDRIALFNDQESINAILTRRDSERRICERRMIVGSHRRETVCETYGQRMARMKGSREHMDKLNRRVQLCREIPSPGPVLNSGGGGVTCVSG